MAQNSGVVEVTYWEYLEEKEDEAWNAKEWAPACQETEVQRPDQKLFLVASFRKNSNSQLMSCHQTVKDTIRNTAHGFIKKKFSFFSCLMYSHQEGLKKI